MHAFTGVPRSVWRDAIVMNLMILLVGVSYGAISQAAGFPLWQTVLLAAVATGGAAELTFVGVIAAGGLPVFAVLGGLLVNARNFAFGLSIGQYAPTGWRTYLAAHLANDEATAFGRAGRTDAEKWSRFSISAILLFVAWVGGAAVGQLLGTVVDANALGLDTALPILLFCLVVGDLRNRLLGVTAAVGAVLAIALTPVAPLGLASVGALLALLPLAGYLRVRGPRHRSEGRETVVASTAEPGTTSGPAGGTGGGTQATADDADPDAEDHRAVSIGRTRSDRGTHGQEN